MMQVPLSVFHSQTAPVFSHVVALPCSLQAVRQMAPSQMQPSSWSHVLRRR
jgi:hypothetical protein